VNKKRREGKSSSGCRLFWRRTIARERLAVFTRQMATLLNAGLPLLRGLEVLARQERRSRFAEILIAVADHVRSGGDFSGGLAHHPEVFNRLYVNVVKAGEASGNLVGVLENLSRLLEKRVKTVNKVRSALVYPIVVLCVAFLIVTGLMIVVIPVFEGVFREVLGGAPLPWPTRFLLGASLMLRHQWIVMIAGGAGLAGAFLYFSRSARGRRLADGALLRIPGLSVLMTKASMVRFAGTFGILLDSGVPILEALKIAGGTAGNRCFEEAVERIQQGVSDGQSLSERMNLEPIYPPLMISMIEVGEETGALPEMLSSIADHYEEDVDHVVTGITSIIEPIMIVLLAGVIGFIVTALFLPIIEMMQGGFG